QIGVDVRFRRYARLEENWLGSDPVPSVIFVEPEYTDGPHLSPNDDHAPTGVQPGQIFLADLYRTLTSNPARWSRTMLVITYDEHGGFFDHVPPLDISTIVSGTEISTTGVRVPAFIISPYVRSGYVFNRPLDHTSLLQVLDDRFVRGEGYSIAVNARQQHLDRILNTLTESPRNDIPPIPTQKTASSSVVKTRSPTAPNTPNAQALHSAAQKLATDHPQLLAQPGWGKLNAYLAKSKT
ncbi:MAG TPA: alkaline phosphatase family protein, partial [Rhizomicrobium sp.]|nr:alkaline phosphatase family protein [Rhizomicrobium sp.]